MNKNLLIMIMIGVVAAGAGFAGGMKYQQTKTPASNRQFGGPGRNGQSGQNRSGFRPVAGDIIAVDAKSITVKLTDGSSKIILFSDTTQINKADQATKDDLKVGAKVAVFGQTNSDGTVVAQSIQLNPIMRR